MIGKCDDLVVNNVTATENLIAQNEVRGREALVIDGCVRIAPGSGPGGVGGPVYSTIPGGSRGCSKNFLNGHANLNGTPADSSMGILSTSEYFYSRKGSIVLDSSNEMQLL